MIQVESRIKDSRAGADPALRMHGALLRAGKFIVRIAESGAYETLAQSHRNAAAQLADVAADLHALGYVDDCSPFRRKQRRRRDMGSRSAHRIATSRT